MKPTLKAPGAKRLKLKYDELLSNIALKFNLRRFTMAVHVNVVPPFRRLVSLAGAHWASAAWLPRDYPDPFGRV